MESDASNTNAQIPYIELLGVRVHRVDMDATLDILRGFIGSGRPHMVVTADSYGVVLAQSDPEFREIVNNADLVTPDSSGILKGAEILGTPLEAKVSGVDIAHNLCRVSGEEGFSIYFLGAAPGVADMAVEKLQEQFPDINVAGIHDGFFSPEQDKDIAKLVRDSGAQVLLVAMGIPRQEKLIRDYMHEMGVCVAMGVGGSFDVFSGQVQRAPVWMQRRGLEWAYRLAKNPRKINKVAVLPRFLALVMKEKLFGRGK